MLGVVPYAMWSATSDAVVPGGSVSAVTAGSGLTGGGTGAVSLDVGAGTGITVGTDSVGVASTYRLPQNCTSGQIVSWSGSAWLCAADGGVTAETDPQVGSLTANLWCASNAGGSAIDCSQPVPATSGHNHDAVYVNVSGDTMSGTLTINQTAGSGNAGSFQINNASNNNPAFVVSTSGSGNVVHATTSGGGNAVYGYTTGTGYAGYFQIANATSSSAALIGLTNGTGTAVHGQKNGGGNSPAVSGLLSVNASGIAVQGLSLGTGMAGYFVIGNSGNSHDALYAETNGSGNAVYGYTSGSGDAVYGHTAGSGAAVHGYHPGAMAGLFDGNVHVVGNLSATGSKPFIQPHAQDPSKEIVYVAIEGPENAIFLRGTARLERGKSVIEMPEYFRVIAGDEGITVQFTPRYTDTYGLGAVKVTKERIVVQELKGGTNTYEFDYFITAKRAGFENHEPIQPNKHFTADNMTKKQFEQKYAKADEMTIGAIRNLLISNGILMGDGKLNMETVHRLGWTIKEADIAATHK
jgi:hypothetical protein